MKNFTLICSTFVLLAVASGCGFKSDLYQSGAGKSSKEIEQLERPILGDGKVASSNADSAQEIQTGNAGVSVNVPVSSVLDVSADANPGVSVDIPGQSLQAKDKLRKKKGDQ